MESGALIAKCVKRRDPHSHVTVGKGPALFAVVATLFIIVANTLNNMTDNGGVFGFQTSENLETINGTIKTRLKLTLAGFAIAAGFALLAMLLAPLVYDRPDHEEHHSTTTTSEKRGTVIYGAQPTTGGGIIHNTTGTTGYQNV